MNPFLKYNIPYAVLADDRGVTTVIKPRSDGTFTAKVKEVPGPASTGRTPKHAQANATIRACIDLAETLDQHHQHKTANHLRHQAAKLDRHWNGPYTTNTGITPLT